MPKDAWLVTLTLTSVDSIFRFDAVNLPRRAMCHAGVRCCRSAILLYTGVLEFLLTCGQEMTWGWAVKGDNLGTPAESAVKASWPDYNATYLSNKLHDAQRRFDPGPLGDNEHDVERQVYLQETLKGYEGEAEACLKAEFEQWLQGTNLSSRYSACFGPNLM